MEFDKKARDNKWMRIELGYRKGGMNYWSGQTEKRGFELGFSLVKKEDNMVIYAPADKSNFRILLKEVSRYSDKAFSELAEKIKKNKEKIFDLYADYLYRGKKLTFDEIKNVALG